VAARADAVSDASKREVRRGHLLLRAPAPPIAVGLIVLTSFLLALLLVPWPVGSLVWEELLLVTAGPALLAAVGTTPLVTALGGRLEWHRGMFLTLTVLVLQLPLALIWRAAGWFDASIVPGIAFLAPFLAGPSLWFRHSTLYGVARASHARMLPASLLQPALMLAGVFVLAPPGAAVISATIAFLVIAFGCAVALIRASDRPLRREFHASGVSLIRPLLDHVGGRDPTATAALEGFFLRSAVPANLRVSLLTFFRGGSPHATIAIPTVHPGPFAALGSSDLPRKLAEELGPRAGTVLVPHTPSDHDLDLPSESEVKKVGQSARDVLASLGPGRSGPSSPLVSPYEGSFARAQRIGDAVIVLATQAPAPTDDIAFSVADRIVREVEGSAGLRILIIDAHNSYIEDQGDIVYGSPSAEKLVADAKAAVGAAIAQSVDGPIEVGVASRSGYTIAGDGIGPQGMRAVAIRAAGRTTGYVLIDGNNLLVGARDPIVASLREVCDDAEIMTTDNHVVHEVDGSINAVGERCPTERLRKDAREVLEAARKDLGPATVASGAKPVPSVQVLGPGYTARLLTSLGDTLSMFTHMFAATLLLLLMSSLVVAFVLG
jgi:putative membrane protein